MPVTYHCDTGEGLLRTQCTGDVTFDEVVAHFATLKDDPAVTGTLDILLDLTETESLPSSNQIRAVAEEFAGLASRIEMRHMAIAAPRDALYGMLRMFEVFTEHTVSESRVFRDLRQAAGWLETLRQNHRPG